MPTDKIHPVPYHPSTALDVRREPVALQAWGGAPAPEPPPPPLPPTQKGWRYLAALNRFKWLIGAFLIIGAIAGYGLTRVITPTYEVQATILMDAAVAAQPATPGAGGDLRSQGWQDMLRSYSIIDPIVNQLSLFVEPARQADSTLFQSFRVAPRMKPGDYELTVTGNRYSLALTRGLEVEKGLLSDSIGRTVGFQWQPGIRALANRGTIAFRVRTPRETSNELRRTLELSAADGSPLISLKLDGPNPERVAATLNAWVRQFVADAKEMKTRNVTSLSRILEGRRQYAADNLSSAEAALRNFQVQTATQPNERPSAAAGLEMTTNPVFDTYFRNKNLRESYQRDRESIERALARADSGALTREALLSIPLIAIDPSAENLRTALKEQAEREVNLRRLQETLTDINPAVVREREALENLRRLTVPASTKELLAQLRLREQQLQSTIDVSGRDLRGIPTRTIEEQRLKRQLEVAAEMYRTLDLEAAKAKLAEAATISDVSVKDSAVAPLRPTHNTAPMIMLGAIGLALLLGAATAILLDHFDTRFRYPEQATHDLGLFVLGVVPDLSARGKQTADSRATQAVEAFRSIRMNVRFAANPARPFAFTITSPGPNDGKSLVAANLALSFAEAGARTLLIDGDIRRGELATTFGIAERPGLVEYLDEAALIAEVLKPVAAHPNLTVIPAGARRRRAPELLATPRLTQLVSQMSAEFDVVVVDSPPLGAGFDAYALATATGNLALVMRNGKTDTEMAEAKMAVVDTLPVTVMGAILNSITLKGVYKYYSYYDDYMAHDDEPARLGQGEPSMPRLSQESQ